MYTVISLFGQMIRSDLYSLLFLIIVSIIFYPLFRLGDKNSEAYVYPSFLKIRIPVIVACIIGPYAIIRIITIHDPDSIFFAILFGLMIGVLVPAVLVEQLLRKPKHNQTEKISIPMGVGVTELLEIVSRSFPEISKERLWVYCMNDDVKNNTFSILPDPTEWRKNSVVVNPIVSVGQLETIAKKVNGKVAGIHIDYKNGIPFLYISK
ncbi:MAG: hypothetical protein LiPW41_568 [Parcubacteria group bacterium LiPW_41]|nr:MAG: hypothetical protein LiPW41_568 [Parcubacteria group bacterium LiPW_41]